MLGGILLLQDTRKLASLSKKGHFASIWHFFITLSTLWSGTMDLKYSNTQITLILQCLIEISP